MNNDIKSMDREDLEQAYLEALDKIERLESEKKVSDENYKNSIHSMKEAITHFKETIASMRNGKFSQSSEALDRIMAITFNEAEGTVDLSPLEDLKEPVISQIPSRPSGSNGSRKTQKNKRKGSGARKGRKHRMSLNDLEIETETRYHKFEEDFFKTNPNIKKAGDLVWHELVYVPGKLKKVIHRVEQAEVKDAVTEDGKPELIHPASWPKPLFTRSLASPSLVAACAYNKYFLALPFSRQAMDFKNQNIPLSRQNLSNWTIKASDTYLQLLVDEMAADLKEADILHCDETVFSCLDTRLELGRKQNYVVQAATGRHEEKGINLYRYYPTRKESFVLDILGDPGKEGRLLTTDGYAGYFGKGFKNSICMDHVRRRFVDAFRSHADYPAYQKLIREGNSEELKKFLEERKDLPFGLLMKILETFRLLYKYEKDFRQAGLKPEEVTLQRLQKSKPVLHTLDQLLVQMEQGAILVEYGAARPEKFLQIPNQSKLGKAISYYCKHRMYMENFLHDGRFDISNSLAENGMRPVAILRKNALFFDTERGAESGMIYLSLMCSARRNGLNPRLYLEYVLEELKNGTYSKEFIRSLLPYAKGLPDFLKEQEPETYDTVEEMEKDWIEEDSELEELIQSHSEPSENP